MPDELALARGWFLKAESDLHTAKRMMDTEGPYDTACFHAQQAAEKYLKGLLTFWGQPFHRTHNLEELQRAGEALPNWPLSGLDLAELSSYAIEAHCDFEFWPDGMATQAALELASEVRRLVLAAIPEDARP